MRLLARIIEEILSICFHPISELLKGGCLQSHGFQPMEKPQHHSRARGTEEAPIILARIKFCEN